MANDFKHKEPSKTERMMYEIVRNQQSMEKGLWSTSTLVIALGILTKTDPEKIAEIMVSGDEQIKEYSKKVNDAIKKLEEAKNGAKGEQEHNHDEPGHTHDSVETMGVEATKE